VGPAADVWGLGVTLFRAATGELPFDEPRPGASGGPQRWPQLRQDPFWPERAPDPLAALIMLCLEREPARRPEPADLHAALEPILGELPKPRLSRLRPRL
jgi:serine/threonine-protein kinase